jgi:uncharacterized protein YndB with AHSA1/START domain
MTAALDHALERTILIRAARSTVFRYFKDSDRFAAWWGAGSRIEGRPGGEVLIRYPNGVTASGRVLEIVEGERVVFTYGYDAPGKPIPPGGSRVTITLEDHPTGTRLHLKHEVAEATTRDQHVAGWRYQLAVFANVAAAEQHREASALLDRYLALWAEPDPAARRAGLAAVVTDDVGFRDAFGCTSGRDDLLDHIAAVQTHMPGVRMIRTGDVRQCQGTAVVDWVAQTADGQARGSGTNVFDLGPDGRIAGVVGLRKA